jgi:prefoldin subunit 5
MGGERAETLSDELERWVEQRTAESDVDREELVRRALAAYRLVDEGDESLESTVERLDRLDGRVDDLEADLDEKVTDVRERVIQVKREADAKAPADHDHPELASDASAAGSEAERALDAVADLRETVSALERRLDEGFENYEEVLEYLTDASEETEEKLDAVASAVYDLRRRATEAERADAERTAATELKREANRRGISTANCQSCDGTVDVALLDLPYCPHCGETFDGVRGKQGLFGSPSLTTGRRPALERPTDGSDDPEPVFEVDGEED